jgi:hypothetical protein
MQTFSKFFMVELGRSRLWVPAILTKFLCGFPRSSKQVIRRQLEVFKDHSGLQASALLQVISLILSISNPSYRHFMFIFLRTAMANWLLRYKKAKLSL